MLAHGGQIKLRGDEPEKLHPTLSLWSNLQLVALLLHKLPLPHPPLSTPHTVPPITRPNNRLKFLSLFSASALCPHLSQVKTRHGP